MRSLETEQWGDDSTRPSAVVLHVPHASTIIPVDVRDQFALSDVERRAATVVTPQPWHGTDPEFLD